MDNTIIIRKKSKKFVKSDNKNLGKKRVKIKN